MGLSGGHIWLIGAGEAPHIEIDTDLWLESTAQTGRAVAKTL